MALPRNDLSDDELLPNITLEEVVVQVDDDATDEAIKKVDVDDQLRAQLDALCLKQNQRFSTFFSTIFLTDLDEVDEDIKEMLALAKESEALIQQLESTVKKTSEPDVASNGTSHDIEGCQVDADVKPTFSV